MNLHIKKLSDKAILPRYATLGSAGLDLSSVEDVELKPGERTLVATGIAIALPSNTVGMVCPRSGLAIKHGVTVLNAPGIIDSDYRGELKVILANLSNKTFKVSQGDRIAQLVITSVTQPQLTEVEALDDTERGNGGFGSTGK